MRFPNVGGAWTKYLVCPQTCGVILNRQASQASVCLQVAVGFRYAGMPEVSVFKFSPAFIALADEADYLGVVKAGISLCSQITSIPLQGSCCTELDTLYCDVVRHVNP